MTEAFIKVDGLSLSVPLYLQRERTARNWAGMFLGAALDPPTRRIAQLLSNVSFEVHQGDRMAILGRNGAGKSTLLRVLNGVYAPTSGRVEVEGSCQALLNMSLGFNSDATVRENIFLRGTAMGMSGGHLRGHIDSILEFSGLAQKSGHRLRTLSSGQKMRLGFAISTTFQHDIMLMDEWVGTGDADFMAKAAARMQSRVDGSKIVVLASHSISLIRELCNKAIVLDLGSVVYAGDIVSSLKYYHELIASLRARQADGFAEHGEEGAYGVVDDIWMEDEVMHVRGWSVNALGESLDGLVIQVAGIRYRAQDVKRCPRPDVKSYMGLSSENCGFRARFVIPGINVVQKIGLDVQFLAGNSDSSAREQLRLADNVVASLKEAQ
jgi:lipopolysaccharide transport system ATP-binding protein